MKGQVIAPQQPNYRDMKVDELAKAAVAFGLTVSEAARKTHEQLAEYCATQWHKHRPAPTSPCGEPA